MGSRFRSIDSRRTEPELGAGDLLPAATGCSFPITNSTGTRRRVANLLKTDMCRGLPARAPT